MVASTHEAAQSPSTITLSGFDARVPIGAMVDLVARHPTLEVGLLLSFTPEGRNRYPDLAWLAEAAQALPGRCAIHVCGMAARAALRDGQLKDLLAHAPRVQVNGVLEPDAVEALAERYPTHTIITQFNRHNTAHVAVRARNHALLVDASCGSGTLPNQWERPEGAKHVGFAGRLAAHNLEAALTRIHAVAAAEPYWIDMETSLRDAEDWFDLAIAHRVLEIFATCQRKQQAVTQVLAAGPGRSLATSMLAILGGA